MTEKAPLIAAIDVGTNSFHLVIASVNNRKMLQIFTREKEVVRLGSSPNDMKYISHDAIERGVKTLSHFAELAKSFNAEVRAVATSAVREANNSSEFIKKVKDETGIDIEIVTGAEEARLIYTGAIHSLPIISKQSLIVDIGGGSTETLIGLEGEVKFVHSAKLGAIRLTQKFFTEEKITPSQIELCREYIKGDWTPILKQIKEVGYETVIGTSGTILNIAMMSILDKREIVHDMINGLTANKKEILRIINKLISSQTTKDRSQIPGIDQARADIIVGGALILETFLNELNIKKITLSSYSLREGIVFDTIQKQESILQFKHLSHLRYSSVINICHQYNVNIKHVEFVKKISFQLFDALQPLHKLGSTERELLESASLLHDVGYHISHDQHHKHSFYLIMNCSLPGFTNDETELIANIARYHRKSHPKKKHENFQKLSAEKQNIIRILSGILRIAEGIDRRQLQVVRDIAINYNIKEINVEIFPATDLKPDIELWGANRRKLLLEEIFKREINFFIN